MKQGWTYKKLGELSVSMADGPFGSNLKKEHYTSEREVRIIQLSNIGEEGWREENTKYTTFEHLENIKRSEVKPNDIVIAKMMPAGRAILCPNHEKKYVLSSDAVKVTLRDDVNKVFVLYSINSPYFRKQVYENVSGSGRVRTSLTKLRNCTLRIPPLSEQQRIVSRLDSAFAHIDALKANAEKQLSDAKALFQKALEKAMEPKEGWEEKKLKEIGETQTGTTPPKSDMFNYGDYMPFIRPAELDFDGKGGIQYDSEIKLSEKGVKKSRLIKSNSILMCCIGSVGKMGFSIKDVTCNQQINTITPAPGFCSKFIYYAMSNITFLEDVIKEAKSAQATLPIISKGKWEKHKLCFPSLSEQQAIVSRLDSLSEKVKRLQEIQEMTIKECDALKQAMLRQVFE